MSPNPFSLSDWTDAFFFQQMMLFMMNIVKNHSDYDAGKKEIQRRQ